MSNDKLKGVKLDGSRGRCSAHLSTFYSAEFPWQLGGRKAAGTVRPIKSDIFITRPLEILFNLNENLNKSANWRWCRCGSGAWCCRRGRGRWTDRGRSSGRRKRSIWLRSGRKTADPECRCNSVRTCPEKTDRLAGNDRWRGIKQPPDASVPHSDRRCARPLERFRSLFPTPSSRYCWLLWCCSLEYANDMQNFIWIFWNLIQSDQAETETHRPIHWSRKLWLHQVSDVGSCAQSRRRRVGGGWDDLWFVQPPDGSTRARSSTARLSSSEHGQHKNWVIWAESMTFLICILILQLFFKKIVSYWMSLK